jgi:glucan biosynthesis protein C
MPEQPDRLYFLDNLRAFVIVCVVVLHGAIAYMDYAPAWWYVVDRQHSLFFTGLVYLIDVPIMMVLFFVSGYFVPPSLMRYDQKTFLKGKFTRIALPWILGVVLMTPPTVYLTYFSRHIPMGLFRFWTSDFWSRNYQQSVYWYLGILFLFFIISSLIYRVGFGRRTGPRRTVLPSWKVLGSFWLVTTLGMFLMERFGSPDTWFTGWLIFVFQPVRLPLYIGYFVLGIVACLNGWFSQEGYKPRLSLWMGLWILSGLLYLGNRFGVGLLGGHSATVASLQDCVLFNAFCFSSLMAGVAFFQRHANGSGRLQKSMADSSYGIYYVHPLILYPLTYLFLGTSLPLYLKATVVIGMALFLSWAVALVLRKTPVLSRAF